MGIKINNKENKVYIVVGAPHSATSFISKLLHENGVDMGSGDRFEEIYEDLELRDLNSSLLHAAGGNDLNPPLPEDVIKNEKWWHLPRLKRYLAKKKGKKFWGFKDPKTSITLGWLLPHLEEEIGGDMYLICCFRKPEKVMKSWEGYTGMTKRDIDRYNRAIIEQIKTFCGLDD